MKPLLTFACICGLSACATSPQIADQITTIGKPGNVEITNLTKLKDVTSGAWVIRWNFVATANTPEQIFWRCEFYDANNLMVGEAARYEEATIYPQQPSSHTCTYPTPAVVNFKISFQNIATTMTTYN